MQVNLTDTPDFDTPTDRRNTLCQKWDGAPRLFGVSADSSLPMWVADTDFRAPDVVQEALQRMVDHGIYGYMGDYGPYKAAIKWWMAERHDWEIEEDWILTTFGLVNAIGIALDVFTGPDDGIITFTPVYHAFARMVNASGRQLVELPLARDGDIYVMDFDAYEKQLTGKEKMILLCSPHNPGGRVWTRQELEELADFARRHDLMIIADEIHQDLVFPGEKHTAFGLLENVADRLITLSATSKTFNLAGHHTGNAIIPNPEIRRAFSKRLSALGLSTTMAGIHAATAAYSPRGANWADAQMRYLDENRQVFDAGIQAIPGLKSMPMQATYLAWVDFSGTGMEEREVIERLEKTADIAANHGRSFGKGGETYMRFNIGTQRSRIEEALRRLQSAFGDLQ
ncbi:MAG: MalY/PatB family protein [Pseudomonadota bacterium]